MKKPASKLHKALTLLTILALLVMILPMAVMASKGFVPQLPDQAADRARQALANRPSVSGQTTAVPTVAPVQPETVATTAPSALVTAPNPTVAQPTVIQPTDAKPTDEEEDEDEAEDSARALFVAERNAWAKSFGIAPGHANLIDKLAFASGVNLADAAAVKAFRELCGAKLIAKENPLSIRDLQAAIRAARAAAGLPAEDEDENDDDDADEDGEGVKPAAVDAGRKPTLPTEPAVKPNAGKAKGPKNR